MALMTWFFLFFIVQSCHISSATVIRVDPVLGDDSTCLSVHELIAADEETSSLPCETINYALTGNKTEDYYNTGNCTGIPLQFSNVTVLLSSGVHSLTLQLELVSVADVTIKAEGSAGSAVIECVDFPNYLPGNFDNIFACSVTGLVFMGIQFERCGPIPSNVFIYNSTGITFESCTFSGNTGSSLQLRFVDHLILRNTTFIGNINNATPISNSVETSIDDLYNIIQTSGGLTFIAGEHSIDVVIENCSFINNRASYNLPNDSRPVLLKQNGHGGGMLVRLSGTTNGSFIIRDSLFENNSAEVDGGAVYITYSDNTVHTYIEISRTTFIDNSVQEAAGGAISLNSFNFTFDNVILIRGCMFTGNYGSAGGSVSMALYDSNLNSTDEPDSILFNNCSFIANSALNEGTAVGLFSLVHVDQVGFLVTITDCHFENNTSLEIGTGLTGDTSALAAFRFPTKFKGRNEFISNTGGGIMLLNTRMQAHGSILFKSNNAIFGGGIMMDDRCLLEVTPHLKMMFIDNHANESGGGIYVEFPPIRFVIDIFNRLCFLQYNDEEGIDVAPQEWRNVSISFINNTARIAGAAIYASDMQRCSWFGSNVSSDNIIFNGLPGLDSPFEYQNNRLELDSGGTVSNAELATAPLKILPSIDFNVVQPGELLSITLSAIDQLNNSREAVWALQSPDQDTQLDALSANNDTFVYTVPALRFLGHDNLLNLNFSLLKTLGENNSLSVLVQACHPGYTTSNESINSSLCVCDNNNDNNIIRCDDQSRYVYLRSGIWGRGVGGSLLTTRVLPGYISCDTQGRLPGCLFEFDKENKQCQEGRTGDLCGQCVNGTGVSLDLQSCSSVPCYAGLISFLLLSCVIVTLFCGIVLLFNVTIPNELRGFLFYAQVIGLVYRPFSVTNTRAGAIDPIAVIVNLLGFSIPIPLCISESLGAQYVALLGYIPPFIMISQCLLFVFGAHFIKRFAHHSAIKGITCLMFFIYKYIADTSFVFLSCATTPLGFRFQYDGSVNCLSPYFGFFFFLSLLIVILFVVPLPFGVCYISTYRGPQIGRPFADVITDGIKTSRRLWGGWDIGRRLIFVFISFFVVLERPSLILFIMSLAALGVLIAHLIVKPYEKEYINIIEALILLDLVLVTGAFLDPDSSSPAIIFGYIFVFLPYVYCIGYIAYQIVSYIRMKTKANVSAVVLDPTVNEESRPEEVDDKASQSVSPPSTAGGTDKTMSTILPGTTNTKTNTIVTGSTLAGESKETTNALREPLLDDDDSWIPSK